MKEEVTESPVVPSQEEPIKNESSNVETIQNVSSENNPTDLVACSNGNNDFDSPRSDDVDGSASSCYLDDNKASDFTMFSEETNAENLSPPKLKAFNEDDAQSSENILQDEAPLLTGLAGPELFSEQEGGSLTNRFDDGNVSSDVERLELLEQSTSDEFSQETHQFAVSEQTLSIDELSMIETALNRRKSFRLAQKEIQNSTTNLMTLEQWGIEEEEAG